MNKQTLKELKTIRIEIESLERELATLKPEYVVDTYKDYSTGYPHIKILEGYSDDNIKRVYAKLNLKIGQLHKAIEITEIELEKIADAELRTILRLTYRNGLTREQTADEMGISARTVIRRLNEFWRE